MGREVKRYSYGYKVSHRDILYSMAAVVNTILYI